MGNLLKIKEKTYIRKSLPKNAKEKLQRLKNDGFLTIPSIKKNKWHVLKSAVLVK